MNIFYNLTRNTILLAGSDEENLSHRDLFWSFQIFPKISELYIFIFIPDED